MRLANWTPDVDGLNEMRARLDRWLNDKAMLDLPVTAAEVRALVDELARERDGHDATERALRRREQQLEGENDRLRGHIEEAVRYCREAEWGLAHQTLREAVNDG